MTEVSLVEADDETAKFRQRQPHWDLPPQHAALLPIVAGLTAAFAGYHQDQPRIVGLRAAQEWRPTSVVCDLDLPTPLSGYDVVRQALTLALEPRPRLVAIGSGDPDESARARAAGFDECLGRPLTVPGLLDALRRRDASSR